MLHSAETTHIPLYGNIAQSMWQWREVHGSNMALKELDTWSKISGFKVEEWSGSTAFFCLFWMHPKHTRESCGLIQCKR